MAGGCGVCVCVCVGATVSIESEQQAAQGKGWQESDVIYILPPLFPASTQVPVDQRGEITHTQQVIRFCGRSVGHKIPMDEKRNCAER
jgi:hypothetical protein